MCGLLVSSLSSDARFLALAPAVVFFLEVMVKLVAVGFKRYASDSFNIFDGAVVLVSFTEFVVPGEGSVPCLFAKIV